MIFGVDWGTRRLSVACPSVGFAWSTSTAGARDKREHAGEWEAGRELGLRAALELAPFGFGGHEFWCERPNTLRGPKQNIRTAVGMALSLGAVTAFLPGKVHVIESSQWKSEVCGDGRADKDAIRQWLQAHRPALAAVAGQEDEFDAFCIGLYGEQMVAAREVPRPEPERVLRRQARRAHEPA